MKSKPYLSRLAPLLRGLATLSLLWVAGFAYGQSEDGALRMVKTLRLGENLAGMTYQFAKLTTTYRGVEVTIGTQKADELLRSEIVAALPKYQEQWNKNLAQAWAPLMTNAEIESVTTEKQQSPFSGKFVSLQDKAGAAMKIKSEPLLKDVLADVLGHVFEKAMPKK